jgi:hypothetical protein
VTSDFFEMAVHTPVVAALSFVNFGVGTMFWANDTKEGRNLNGKSMTWRERLLLNRLD